jgi:hypothetical protein
MPKDLLPIGTWVTFTRHRFPKLHPKIKQGDLNEGIKIGTVGFISGYRMTPETEHEITTGEQQCYRIEILLNLGKKDKKGRIVWESSDTHFHAFPMELDILKTSEQLQGETTMIRVQTTKNKKFVYYQTPCETRQSYCQEARCGHKPIKFGLTKNGIRNPFYLSEQLADDKPFWFSHYKNCFQAGQFRDK